MEKTSSSDRNFISFILNYMCNNKAKEMRILLEDLTKYMQSLDPKCEPNLFRKQYGNMKACFKLPAINNVFFLDANLVKFQPENKMKNRKDSGIISEADYKKYLQALDIYWTHELGVKKSLGENVCKTCKRSYKVSVNKEGCCDNGAAHIPSYDWTKSEDVLKCKI